LNEDMHECMSEQIYVHAGCLPIRGRFLQQGSAPRWPPYSKGRAASAGPTQSPCQLISPSIRTVMTLVSPVAANLLSNAAHPFLLVRIHVSLIFNRLTRLGRALEEEVMLPCTQQTSLCATAACCLIHALITRMNLCIACPTTLRQCA